MTSYFHYFSKKWWELRIYNSFFTNNPGLKKAWMVQPLETAQSQQISSDLLHLFKSQSGALLMLTPPLGFRSSVGGEGAQFSYPRMIFRYLQYCLLHGSCIIWRCTHSSCGWFIIATGCLRMLELLLWTTTYQPSGGVMTYRPGGPEFGSKMMKPQCKHHNRHE